MTHKKINKENFANGMDLWVSTACHPKGNNEKTTYWCTIDQWNNGNLIYLARSVWSGLTEVNTDTVFAELAKGIYEITEATDDNGDVLMSGDEVIFQICKSKETKHFTFK